jgi:hypothetical protein
MLQHGGLSATPRDVGLALQMSLVSHLTRGVCICDWQLPAAQTAQV